MKRAIVDICGYAAMAGFWLLALYVTYQWATQP